jgi:tRNA-splicing endonuclease subunit Sen34
VLIDDPQAHPEPSIPELQRWATERTASIKHQTALSEAKGAKESATSGRAMTEAAIQKRKEREGKRVAEAAEAAASSDRPSPLLDPLKANTPSLSPSPQPETPALGAPATSASTSYTVVIPASSLSFEWCNSERCTYTTIASAKAAGIWEYPSNLHERAKCGVFRGLWEQGYFMGGGIKFGGDYLVYPGLPSQLRSPDSRLTLIRGDPLRYHSHFAASVLDSPTSALRPMEIVAHGRLGTATKKAHLLCGWDDEKQDLSYLSIEWAGFG